HGKRDRDCRIQPGEDLRRKPLQASWTENRAEGQEDHCRCQRRREPERRSCEQRRSQPLERRQRGRTDSSIERIGSPELAPGLIPQRDQRDPPVRLRASLTAVVSTLAGTMAMPPPGWLTAIPRKRPSSWNNSEPGATADSPPGISTLSFHR